MPRFVYTFQSHRGRENHFLDKNVSVKHAIAWHAWRIIMLSTKLTIELTTLGTAHNPKAGLF